MMQKSLLFFENQRQKYDVILIKRLFKTYLHSAVCRERIRDAEILKFYHTLIDDF